MRVKKTKNIVLDNEKEQNRPNENVKSEEINC